MSGPDRWEDFERRLADRFADALAQFRGSVRERLATSNAALLAALDDLEPPSHPTFSPAELAELAPAAAPPPIADPFADLLRGFAALDRATSQAEILEALLAAALGFASRAAVFLTRADGAQGWGSSGFPAGDPISGRQMSYEKGGPWSQVAEGDGVVALDSAATAEVAVHLEIPAGAEAVLIPLVLRDRIAAALYADRLSSDPALEVAALQLLTLEAAQCLELLALRSRRETPTLHRAAAEGAPAERLALWEPATVAASAPKEVAAPVHEELAQEFEFAEEPAAIEILEPDAVAAAPDLSPFAPSSAERIAPVGGMAVEAFSEDWEIAEPTPIGAPAAEPALFEESPVAEPAALEASAHGFELAVGEQEPASASVAPTVETTTAPFWTSPAEPTPAEISVAPPPVAAPEPSPLATQAWSWQAPAAPAPAASPAATIATPAAPQIAIPAVADDATVMVQRVEPTPPPIVPPPPPTDTHDSTEPGFSPPRAEEREDAMDRTSSGRRTTEVLPPPDLMGPGLAFTQRQGAPRPTGENALHDEARRLARLLVSEIKLYNEEQVDEGRRNRDIYHRLKEDIDRSRQIYEERIHESIRGTTDYFHQELVRSLGGGDPRALGI
ncbi:MAG: hypothetical protein U0X73_10955 [Thermoanaerobaculia bacterium]